jgi:hypothetical protein
VKPRRPGGAEGLDGPTRTAQDKGVADLLAEVIRATASVAGADALLDRAATALLSRADWVIADRLEDPDVIVRVAAVDRTGALPLGPRRGSPQWRRSSASTLGVLPAALAAPHHMLRLDKSRLEELAHAPRRSHESAQAAGALALGTTELLVVGLMRREVPLGALTLGIRGGGFSTDEIAELGDVAAYLGVALEAARLHTTQAAVATAMQHSLLPPLPVVPGLRLAARYSPAAGGLDVGGDWYDAFPSPAGLTVVVGDALGHDVAAAARMAELRNLLRAHAVDHDEPPSQVISRLERSAAALALDAMATCLVGRLEPGAGGSWRMTWSSAGHLPPVLLRDGRACLLETTADLMFGVERDSDRCDHVTELGPGDVVVLYTDGLIEKPGEALAGRLELLRREVERFAADQPDELVDELIADFIGDSTDDVALFAIGVASGP